MSTKGQTFPAEHLRRSEVLAVLDACGDTWAGRRNRALIAIMWRSGLRISEALALTKYDLDWDAQTIRVLHGKGDKARTTGMDDFEMKVIREWLEVRGDLGGPLICTRKGTPVLQSYVRTMLPRVARAAGIGRRVHAHIFRHTFAVELARERVPMIHIQRLLGHSSLATTSVYLASLAPEEALDAIRSRKVED